MRWREGALRADISEMVVRKVLCDGVTFWQRPESIEHVRHGAEMLGWK